MRDLMFLDGHIEKNRFILREIQGQEIHGSYSADGLRSMARLIHDNEPFHITLDKNKTLSVPVKSNKLLKKELNMIADELEGQ